MAGAGHGRFGRLTFFLLLLNLLALVAGVVMERYMAVRPAQLVEFNAEKIRFWSQPGAGRDTPSGDSSAPAAAVVKPVRSTFCIEVAEPGQARFQELAAKLSTAGFDDGQCAYRFDTKLPWWVFWPPEYEAGKREQAVRAFQSAGVKDVLKINQGAMAQAFSLGVFSSEGQARLHRDTLRSKGLTKAEYGPRPSVASMRLECQPRESGRVDAFIAGLPDWARPLDAAGCSPAGDVIRPGR